ncbi:MAG: hypothetical protein U9Q85_01965 [Patescibacteria group bacterium]|nr:hypothetical protein [Patescibacteria group bacterium]
MKKNRLILAFIYLSMFAFIAIALPVNIARAGLWDMQNDTLSQIETTFKDVTPTDEPEKIIVEVIKIFLGFVGLITVAILIWGGFRWMNAGGNDDELGKAKKTIIRALIGLAIIIASYSILQITIYLFEDAIDGW